MRGECRGAVGLLVVCCLEEDRVGIETEEEAEGRSEDADQLWKAGIPIIIEDCESDDLCVGV